MRPKDIYVDFYRPVINAFEPVPLGELIDRVGRITDDDSRSLDLGGNPIRLARLEEIDGHLIGEMVRLRMDEPAILGDVGGNLQTVVAREDQGLSKFTCFLYNRASNILCLERNRIGVGQKNFCIYFRERGHLEGTIDLQILVLPGVLERVGSVQKFRSLEVSIVPLSTQTRIPEQQFVSDALQTADRLEAPHIFMKFSMGHKGGSLNRRGILQAIRELWTQVQEGGQIERLRLTGTEGADDEATPIDLLENKIGYDEQIQLSHDPDQIYEARKNLLRRAWNAKRTIIRDLLLS